MAKKRHLDEVMVGPWVPPDGLFDYRKAAGKQSDIPITQKQRDKTLKEYEELSQRENPNQYRLVRAYNDAIRAGLEGEELGNYLYHTNSAWLTKEQQEQERLYKEQQLKEQARIGRNYLLNTPNAENTQVGKAWIEWAKDNGINIYDEDYQDFERKENARNDKQQRKEEEQQFIKDVQDRPGYEGVKKGMYVAALAPAAVAALEMFGPYFTKKLTAEGAKTLVTNFGKDLLWQGSSYLAGEALNEATQHLDTQTAHDYLEAHPKLNYGIQFGGDVVGFAGDALSTIGEKTRNPKIRTLGLGLQRTSGLVDGVTGGINANDWLHNGSNYNNTSDAIIGLFPRSIDVVGKSWDDRYRKLLGITGTLNDVIQYMNDKETKDNKKKYGGVIPPFVQRYKEGQRGIKQKDGSVATHKLSYAEDEGKYIVYPNVQPKNYNDPNSSLVDYEGLGWFPFDRAVKYNDTLQFNTAREAEEYTKHYKDFGREGYLLNIPSTINLPTPRLSFKHGGKTDEPPVVDNRYKRSATTMGVLQHLINNWNKFNYNEPTEENLRDANGGLAQATYLINRRLQDKLFRRADYIPISNPNYGLISKAVGNRNIPMYQTAPDSISRDKLLLIGDALGEDEGEIRINNPLVHAGRYPVALYVNPRTGEPYANAWDLNDYAGTSSNADNKIPYYIQNFGAKMLDKIGNPVVVTTGYQKIDGIPDILAEKMYKKHHLIPTQSLLYDEDSDDINDLSIWSLPEVEIVGNRKSLKNGGSIYIKPSHRGRFTELKERTGHSSTWFKENGTPAQKKMATFALNAKRWKHQNGGSVRRRLESNGNLSY